MYVKFFNLHTIASLSEEHDIVHADMYLLFTAQLLDLYRSTAITLQSQQLLGSYCTASVVLFRISL